MMKLLTKIMRLQLIGVFQKSWQKWEFLQCNLTNVPRFLRLLDYPKKLLKNVLKVVESVHAKSLEYRILPRLLIYFASFL